MAQTTWREELLTTGMAMATGIPEGMEGAIPAAGVQLVIEGKANGSLARNMGEAWSVVEAATW